jgi:hypothetical protein
VSEQNTTRIAMWSGPRNISTAMMRSFGSRDDTVVVDEPFYAYYLTQRDVDHPGTDEVIEHHETDPDRIIERLTGPLPDGTSVFYQKHMAHHMIPELDRDWINEVTSCFLIREPREMLTSLIEHMPDPELKDTGLPQQLELFRQVRDRTGKTPHVLRAQDVLENPREMLATLCDRVGIPFDEDQLSWEPGLRETDGVWAKHWYDSVKGSTGFKPYTPKDEEVPDRHRDLLAACNECYYTLYEQRMTA